MEFFVKLNFSKFTLELHKSKSGELLYTYDLKDEFPSKIDEEMAKHASSLGMASDAYLKAFCAISWQFASIGKIGCNIFYIYYSGKAIYNTDGYIINKFAHNKHQERITVYNMFYPGSREICICGI